MTERNVAWTESEIFTGCRKKMKEKINAFPVNVEQEIVLEQVNELVGWNMEFLFSGLNDDDGDDDLENLTGIIDYICTS